MSETGERQSLGTLKRQTSRGAAWVILALLSTKGLSFATNLILAHLLSPAEFGIVGFAMVVIGGFTLLQDLGTPMAIVYSKRSLRELAGTSLTINVVAALTLFAVTAAAAPWIATFAGQPAVRPVVTILALGLVLSSLGSVHGAMLTKDLDFRRKFLPDVAAPVASAITAIVLALLGFGAWSLVAGYLFRGLTSTVLLWVVADIRPFPAFNRTIAAELFGYGGHVSINGILGFAANNLDYLLIGHFLGAAALGIYTFGYTSTDVLATTLGSAGGATFPAFSRLRDDRPAMSHFVIEVVGLTLSVAVPAGLAMFVLAPAYIPLVLGQRWEGVVGPLQALITFAVLRCLEYHLAAAYRAVGHPEIIWKFSVVKLLVLAAVMLLVIHHGVIAVGATQSAVELVFIPTFGFVLSRHLQTSWREIRGALGPPLVAGAASALVILACLLAQPLGGIRDPFTAAGLMVVVAAVYTGALVTLNPRVVTLGTRGMSSILGRTQKQPVEA